MPPSSLPQNVSYVLAQRNCYATGQPPSDFWQRPRRAAEADVTLKAPTLGLRASSMMLLSDSEPEMTQDTATI